jgi:succinyl-CoA synthetase beta subunit
MKIHEYQGKQLLARYGVTVPRGEVVESADRVAAIVERLGLPVVVKAQIHAGGRGKVGGEKLARNA